jgi:2-haloacid dehalogenase
LNNTSYDNHCTPQVIFAFWISNALKIMIKAVVFDAYGTLFDVYAISALAERLYPNQGAAISTLWRDKQIEYTRLISLSDPHNPSGSRHYLPFWELTRLSLRYTLARLKLVLTPENEEALMGQYAHLTAFPENLGVLQTLKVKGFATAILSNGNPEMLDSAVVSAGMQDLLDHVISVDEIKQFKTSPSSYALVTKYFPVQTDEILFVSSNAWDALGATWHGFQTLWVNRQGLPYETLGPKPSFTGSNLVSLLDVLNLQHDK